MYGQNVSVPAFESQTPPAGVLRAHRLGPLFRPYSAEGRTAIPVDPWVNDAPRRSGVRRAVGKGSVPALSGAAVGGVERAYDRVRVHSARTTAQSSRASSVFARRCSSSYTASASNNRSSHSSSS
jgi:hypothetical protein